MNWIQRKIFLYNVTFGLFMLDWWERYIFNILVIMLMWFIFYNGSRYVTDFFQSLLLVMLYVFVKYWPALFQAGTYKII